MSTGLGRGGPQLRSWRGDVYSWGSQAGCWRGHTHGSGLVFAGGRGSRDPFSGTPADHGGGSGAAPSQAAWLLLLHCFTVGGVCGGKGLFMNIFFSMIFFLPDLLAPSCKGSCRCSGEEEQEKSKLRGSETQVSAELKQSFLALLLSSLLAWPWVGVGGKDLLTCLKQLYKLAF